MIPTLYFRSPPEAWDTRSEPDTRSTKESDDDCLNVTNTSYNLLDLDPYYNGDIESSSPPRNGMIFLPFTYIRSKSLLELWGTTLVRD